MTIAHVMTLLRVPEPFCRIFKVIDPIKSIWALLDPVAYETTFFNVFYDVMFFLFQVFKFHPMRINAKFLTRSFERRRAAT